MSSYSINGRHPKWRMVVLSAVSLAFVDAFVATVSFAAPDANTASSSTANSEPGTAAIDQKTPTGSTAAVDPRMNEDARKLFGAKKKPASLPTLSIGTATCGCIAGAKKLALNGPYWQVMRPSRNRYYGHPSMLTYIEKFAKRAHDVGWESLLIGDLNMPRG